jgi:hypothetical protein
MNSFIFDASALAKRYTLETGSALIDDLFSKVIHNPLMCLALGAVAERLSSFNPETQTEAELDSLLTA